jgi:membrane protease YdiL (CAAX protease family)/RNA polymerase subunit RPABC4/transcription elongation factor Spt4
VTQKACANCGHPLSETARFCPNCGRDVTEPSSTVLVATDVETDAGSGKGIGGFEGRPVRWRALEGLGIFFIAVIVTLLAMVPIGFALRPITNCGAFRGLESARCFNHRDLFTALSIGVNEAALLAVVLLWIRFVHNERPHALGFREMTAANAGIGVAVGVSGLIVAGIISSILTSIVENVSHKPVEAPKQITLQTNPATLALVIVGVSVIVLAPLAEEAFFRGFIFQRLRSKYGVGVGIVVSAAVFGLAHLIPLIILPIFGLGVLLAAIVNTRKSIIPSIFAHATFNAVGFLQLFVHFHR